MRSRRLLVVSQVLMIGCALAAIFMALMVDGNGGFMGLKEGISIFIWATNLLVGIASAGYVYFRAGHWKALSLLMILIYVILQGLLGPPLLLI
jgi:hypothetical protein